MNYLLLILIFISSLALANDPDPRADLSTLNSDTFLDDLDLTAPLKSLKSNGQKIHLYKGKAMGQSPKVSTKTFSKLRSVSTNNNADFIYTISEVENNNVVLLTLELDSKNIAGGEDKYEAFKIEFNLFKDGELVLSSSESSSYEVAGKRRFDLDITELAVGTYTMDVTIYSHHSKHKNKKKVFRHNSKVRFERLYFESAVADLKIAQALPGNYRVLFDMSDSYSLLDEIKKYTVRLFKDGAEVEFREIDPKISTQFSFIFTEIADYQVELEVFDSTDSDTARSEIIRPAVVAPKLEYKLIQDQTYSDIFEIDFSGTTPPANASISGYVVQIYQNGVQVGFKFSRDEKFSFQVEQRGSFAILAIALASNGTNNFDLSAQYIDPNQVKSLFLNYSHKYTDENDPRLLYLAFTNQVAQQDFKQWNVTRTNIETGQTVNFISRPYIYNNFILHALVAAPVSGEYRFTVQLELNDGTISAPFSINHIYDFDLGEAVLDIKITKNEGEIRSWNIDPEDSSPGNYGFFRELSCNLSHPNESISIDLLNSDVDVNLNQVGAWNVSCFARANTGLTASFNTTIEVENILPEGSFNIELVNENQRQYKLNINTNDRDGSIASQVLNIIKPDGSSKSVDAFDGLFLNLNQIGDYNFEVVLTDNEAGVSRLSGQTISIQNKIPLADFTLSQNPESLRQYTLSVNTSDSDGYIVSQKLKITKPDGSFLYFDAFSGLIVGLSDPGIYRATLEVIDNDGGVAAVSDKIIEIINQKPQVSLTVESIDVNTRSYRIETSEEDIDGYIIRSKLDIRRPDGVIISLEGIKSLDQIFSQIGSYNISFQAQDNDGEWSEVVSETINVENIAPVAAFEISQVSSDRYYFVLQNSYDLDGYLVEYDFTFTSPSGIITKRSDFFGFEVQLSELGTWNISLRVKDNDGEWSDLFIQEISSGNSTPIASYELSLENNTRELTIIADASDEDGQIAYHSLKATHSDGTILEEVFTGNQKIIQLSKVGEWTIELQAFDNDGAGSEIFSATILVDNPLLPPVAFFECTFTRNNTLACENRSSDSYREITTVSWQINGSTFGGNQNSVSFPIDEIGDYEVGIVVTNSAGLSDEKTEVISVESIFSNLLSEINISFNLTNEYFHDLNSDFILNIQDGFLDEETFQSLEISINNLDFNQGLWSDFSGELLINKSLLQDGLNDIVVNGLDINGNEISKELTFYSGERNVEFNLAGIRQLHLKSTTEGEVEFKFNNTSVVEFVPKGEYLATIVNADGSHSEFVDITNSDFFKTVSVNSLILSQATDINMANGLDGWSTNLGEISLKEITEGVRSFRSLQLNADSSGFGHVQKKLQPLSSNNNFISYKVDFNSLNIGDKFFFTLSNLSTDEVKSFSYKSKSLGKFTKYITIPISSDLDNLVIDAYIEISNLGNTVKLEKFSIINSAYSQASGSDGSNLTISGAETPLEFTFYNLRGDIAGSAKNQETGDYSPYGISIGTYSDVDGTPVHGGKNIFRVGFNSSTVTKDFIVENIAVRFRLMQKQDVAGPISDTGEIGDILLDEVVKKPYFSVTSGNEFYIELLESDFDSQYHISTIPDYVKVSICEAQNDLDIIVNNNCVDMNPYMQGNSYEFAVLNRFALFETYSGADNTVGGDLWVSNKLYPHIRDTLEEVQDIVLVGDFSAINGGYWRDHRGRSNRGSHYKGDTLDFIVRTPNGNHLSLRQESGGRNLIKQNLETATNLTEVFNANSGYMSKHINSNSGFLSPQNRNLLNLSEEDFNNYEFYLASQCSPNNKLLRDIEGNRTNNGRLGNITSDSRITHNNHFHAQFNLSNLGGNGNILNSTFSTENGENYFNSIQHFRTLSLPDKVLSHDGIKLEFLYNNGNDTNLASLGTNIKQEIFIYLKNAADELVKIKRVEGKFLENNEALLTIDESNEGLDIASVILVGYNDQTGECKSQEYAFNPFQNFDNQEFTSILFTPNSTPHNDLAAGVYYFADRDSAISVEYSPGSKSVPLNYGSNYTYKASSGLNIEEYPNRTIRTVLLGDDPNDTNIPFSFMNSTGYALMRVNDTASSSFATRTIYNEGYLRIMHDNVQVPETQMSLSASIVSVDWGGTNKVRVQTEIKNHFYGTGRYEDEYFKFFIENTESGNSTKKAINPIQAQFPYDPAYVGFVDSQNPCGLEFVEDENGNSFAFLRTPKPSYRSTLFYENVFRVFRYNQGSTSTGSQVDLDFDYRYSESSSATADCVGPYEDFYGTTPGT